MAAKRGGAEKAYSAGIPLVHGGAVHYPDESVCTGKARNRLLKTVEGNCGDSCRENRYDVGHYEIYGYGTPAY